jgi:hypothetical protein
VDACFAGGSGFQTLIKSKIIRAWLASKRTAEARRPIGGGEQDSMSVVKPEPATPTLMLRWYWLTPDRLVFVLLVIEFVLWLSERFRWFPFNLHKGWTVLIALAAVGMAFLIMALWFVAALIFRWRFQFGIRSLLAMVVVVAVPFSWLAVQMKAAREQKRVVDAIRRDGGSVLYNLPELPPGLYSYGKQLPESPWLQDLLGEDFVGTVNLVSYYSNISTPTAPAVSLEFLDELPQLQTLEIRGKRITDSGWNRLNSSPHLHTLSLPADTTDEKLECLQGMTELKTLDLSFTAITDFGLKHVAKMARLEYLSLHHTKITDSGLAHLQGMRTIETILLSATPFTDAGVKYLTTLPHLRSLGLLYPSHFPQIWRSFSPNSAGAASHRP